MITNDKEFINNVTLCGNLQDKEPKGIIPLENIQVRVSNEKSNKPHCFELYATTNEIIKACKVDKEGKVVEGNLNFPVIQD